MLNLAQDIVLPDSRSIGRYQVLDLLFSGGTTTYLKVQDEAGATFAMKVPHRDSARDTNLRGRFMREKEILQALQGPAFPSLQASGSYEGMGITDIPYLVTDIPRGVTLDKVLDERKGSGQPPDVVGGIALLRNLAQALKEVHDKSIVHRNLKPQRVAVGDGMGIQILDFVLGLGATGTALTGAGVLIGTPQYIAPEQIIDSHSVDGRADLFSLGLIIYEYVTHKDPYGEATGSLKAEIMKKLTQEPKPAREQNSAISPEFEAVLTRLLKRAPEERFQTADELLAEMDRTLPKT